MAAEQTLDEALYAMSAAASELTEQLNELEREQQEAERKKYCEAMRTNLAQLQNNPRLRMDVDGEMRRLGEDERQAKIAESEKAIKENCN